MDHQTQHDDARKALQAQNRSTNIFSVLLTAGLGLLGWISLQLFEMNGTLRSLETQVTESLKTQEAQQESIADNEQRIRDNAEQIEANEARIQRNRKTLHSLDEASE